MVWSFGRNIVQLHTKYIPFIQRYRFNRGINYPHCNDGSLLPSSSGSPAITSLIS